MANTRGAASALPVLQWLPAYQRAWLRRDIVAGLTLAAYLASGGDRRRLTGGPSARGGPLRLPFFRTGLLAVL